ncbi:MAG TPA: heavy metal translocating P-type ATPase [Flavobacterium sp.]|jgi:Cu2+-exporting ATPase
MKHTYQVTGMTCSGCEAKVKYLLEATPGVTSAEVSKDTSTAIITMNNHIETTTLQDILGGTGSRYKIFAPGSTPHLHHKEHQHHPQSHHQKHEDGSQYYCPMHCEGDKIYDKPGSCPVCGMNLEKVLHLKRPSAKFGCPMHPEVESDQPGSCPICGMDLVLMNAADEDDENYKSLLGKFYIASAFSLPILFIAMAEMFSKGLLTGITSQTNWNWIQLFLCLPVIYVTRMFFERAWFSLKSRKLNMFTLIGLGTGVAFAYSIIALVFPDAFPHDFRHNGAAYVYFEAVAVILALVLLGQLLEARAHSRTNSAIKALLNLVPETANQIIDGQEIKVPVENIHAGDFLRVKPGERIPVDGYITEGEANIDESMISGEPIPVDKKTGDKVTSGTINSVSSFIMKAEKVGTETLLSRIIQMVNDASRSRAPIQKLVDKVAGYFVPIVIAIAILTFLSWVLLGGEHRFVYGLTNAISVLIIACPCALGLATPMSVMVGIGRGAQAGVLIKNAEALENLRKVDTLIVDKTGTLTQGKPSLEEIEPTENFNREELLWLAASLNNASEHPLAKAVVRHAQEKQVRLSAVSNFTSMTGKGVKGNVDGKEILLGNIKLLIQESITIPQSLQDKAAKKQQQGKTVSFIAVDKIAAGFITISDKIKKESKETVQKLLHDGISVIMLTGDNPYTAKAVASELKLSSYEAEMLPEDKLNKIRELQQQGKVVAMAGDGINDAPALAQANVGIAMGTGTDVAIESAAVTLVHGDLSGIGKAFTLSRKVMRNIKQNLFFAFFYNVLGIPIAAGILYPFMETLLSPMIAGAAMSISSVSVILNSLRLRALKL